MTFVSLLLGKKTLPSIMILRNWKLWEKKTWLSPIRNIWLKCEFLLVLFLLRVRLNSCCLSLGAGVYFFLHEEIRLDCTRTPLLSKQWKFRTFLTLRNIENVVPGLSVSLVSSSVVDNSCLFSSQLPEDSLKLEEVHQECLKHAWLHDISSVESIFLTT